MAVRPTKRPTVVVKPWHRAVAWVALVGSFVVAVLWLRHDATTPAQWSKRIGLPIFVLSVVGGISASIAAPRPTAKVFAWLGWAFPAVLVWVGIELWLDWHEFRSSGTRRAIHSEAGARVEGTIVIVLGVALLALYVFCVRTVRRRRRELAAS